MENQTQRGTLEQLGVFTQIVVSGKISYDQLQAIIDEYVGKPSLKRRRLAGEEADRQALASLDNLIEKLAVVLGDKMAARQLVADLPFTDFKPKYVRTIKGIMGDQYAVARRVRSAVFWTFPGPREVYFVTPSELASDDLSESLAKSLLRDFLHASPEGKEPVLHALVSECLVARYTASKKPASVMRAKSIASVVFARGRRREDAAKFVPISQLWDDGIFPMGFDKEQRLAVLVGDFPM